MSLSNLDFFSIQKYSFAIQRTSSYFSLATVLMSLVIITLSALINWTTISHLWIDRAQLNIQSSQRSGLPGALTSTLICYKPIVFSQFLPQASIVNEQNQELKATFVSQTQVAKTNPKLKQFIGEGFGCIDLKEISFTNFKESIFLEIDGSVSKVYVGCSSVESILAESWLEPMVFLAEDSPDGMCYGCAVTFVEATIQDQLNLAYSEKIVTFQKINEVNSKYQSSKPSDSNFTYFALKLSFSFLESVQKSLNYNINSINIQRYNIGYILGTFLSFVSFFSLLINFVVGPIMAVLIDFVLIECLFHVEGDMKKPSLFKYFIASIKPGICQKEDEYIRMSNKISMLKDLNFMLKLLFQSRRINNASIDASEQRIIQFSRFEVAKQFCDKYQLQDSNEVQTRVRLDYSYDQCTISFLRKIRQNTLKYFDKGLEDISVNFDKGFGSAPSLAMTAIFFIALVAFLILFGVFQTSKTYMDTEVMGMNEFTHTLKKGGLFLATRTLKMKSDCHVLNGKYQIISQCEFGDFEQCKSIFQSYKGYQIDNQYSYIYCFKEDVILHYSQDKSQQMFVRLNFSRVQIINDDFFFGFLQFGIIDVLQEFQMLDQNIIVESFKQFFVTLDLLNVKSSFTQLPFRVVDFKNQTYAQTFGQPLTFSLPRSNILANNMNGLILKAASFRKVTVSSSTFFDIVQNIWSFTTIWVSMLLMKIAKHINIHERKLNITPGRADQVDNVCVLLSKVNGLIKGRNRKEFQTLKHYIKQPYCLMVK